MISHALWILIVIQMLLGAFDTLYHHELTLRLAWQPSQRRELLLHGVRNLAYAVVFIALGWFVLFGYWAVLLIVLLVIEIFVTLTDFVEEDLSRKLPASERINHTLLTLNYGAILALLMPLLVAWATRETAVERMSYGLFSAMSLVAAVGVTLFGIRDLAASARLKRLASNRSAGLLARIRHQHHVLVTGATGFIGSRLVEALADAGHQVTVLTRDATKAAAFRSPFRLVTDLKQIPNDAVIDSIVNLAGEPVAGGLWTLARRRRILRSRLTMLRDVKGLVDRLYWRPSLLIQASAVGWYGLWRDETLTEASPPRPCFSHRSCASCEEAALAVRNRETRVVLLRIGLVLGTEGGLLARLLAPFEFGLGGPMGRGTQWMSWIERDDLVRLIAHVVATPTLEGPVNATAPNPVTNGEFTRALARALGRPAFLRVPAALLRRLAGDLAEELLLGGQRVLPQKAAASGFKFRYGSLENALAHMLGARPAARTKERRGIGAPRLGHAHER